ncbi:MAG: hypothetical protein QM776_13570 [Rhodocyclaceae bacterium]
MRFFVLENGLRTAAGHHLNNSLGLRQSLAKHDVPAHFLINRKADPTSIAALDARACISFTPYDQASNDELCGEIESLHIQANMIAAELGNELGSQICADDVLLVPTATQHEILALAWMLRRLSPDRLPRVILNFVRENFLAPETYAPGSIAGLYRFAAKALRRSVPGRCLMTSNGARMSEMLSHILHQEVVTCPIPKTYPAALVESTRPREPGGRLRVGVFGDMNGYKGFGLIPALIEAFPDLDWLVQAPKDGSARYWGPLDESMRAHPNLELVAAGISPERYYALFGAVDIVLTPYDMRLKRLQTSGVFAEAVAAGKVVVAPATPWVMEHRQQEAWCGEVFEAPDAGEIAAALSRICENFVALSAGAAEKSATWRQTQSVDAYVARMLEWLDTSGSGDKS